MATYGDFFHYETNVVYKWLIENADLEKVNQYDKEETQKYFSELISNVIYTETQNDLIQTLAEVAEVHWDELIDRFLKGIKKIELYQRKKKFFKDKVSILMYYYLNNNEQIFPEAFEKFQGNVDKIADNIFNYFYKFAFQSSSAYLIGILQLTLNQIDYKELTKCLILEKEIQNIRSDVVIDEFLTNVDESKLLGS